MFRDIDYGLVVEQNSYEVEGLHLPVFSRPREFGVLQNKIVTRFQPLEGAGTWVNR